MQFEPNVAYRKAASRCGLCGHDELFAVVTSTPQRFAGNALEANAFVLTAGGTPLGPLQVQRSFPQKSTSSLLGGHGS